MQIKAALAAAAGTVLGFTMIATGPAFADGGHHHQSRHESDKHCSGTRTSEQDREWLKGSIQGDHFEITGGHLAENRGVDAMTKALGARLVSDHSQSLSDAVDLAHELGITPPQTMSEKQQHEIADVSKDGYLHFDDEYSELEISDHKMDISDATKEWREGCNPKVRDEAKTEIPMLREHLSLSIATSNHIETLPGHESDTPNGSSTGNQD
jgi:putative membrane protein